MKVDFLPKAPSESAVFVVFVADNRKLIGLGEALDRESKGALGRALSAPKFTAKQGQVLDVLSPAGLKQRRVLIVGLGQVREISVLAAREIGASIVTHLQAEHEASATLLLDLPKGTQLEESSFAANLAFGAKLQNYRFDKYRKTFRADEPKPMKALRLVTAADAAASKAAKRLDAVANGVALARDLTNEPPVEIYPETFVERAKELTKLGVQVEALDEKAMAKLGMGGVLAVGKGSKRPPRLLVLRWSGAKGKRKNERPVALVGKGVCFDSGGLCIKTGAQMETMKGDMAGGAAVIGTIRALAERKAAIDVVGVVALVENMPSGSAFKPGDIVTTMAGKTMEIFDTDAEGRVILVDALWYTAQKFNPRCIIDLATLTYSVMQALGKYFTGLFCNDDKLARDLSEAGQLVGERLWRLPLDPAYEQDLTSSMADFRQFAPDADKADAAYAAALLHQFVDGHSWAHLDIASKELISKEKPMVPAGGSGHGVALLEQYIAGLEGLDK
ncbi:MAG: leucyl aminopeptidase [Rhodospirillaceae bacterium]|nr:MAG: leucyl aminopeptidase [Rhodospirillaceae bacterium]